MILRNEITSIIFNTTTATIEDSHQASEFIIDLLTDAYERGRVLGLREAAQVAEGWYRNMGKTTPHAEIMAHIPDAHGSK